MFNKILVATDGSEFSRRAFNAAVECARCFNAEILLIFVFKQPRNYGTFSGLKTVEYSDEQIKEIGDRVFEATTKNIDTAGIAISTKVSLGMPANVITDESNAGADMIVMGSQGHGTISGVVTGSVAQKVLSLCTCPIMIVK